MSKSGCGGMPVPGYHFQTWMLTEVQDLRKAVSDKVSTEHCEGHDGAGSNAEDERAANQAAAGGTPGPAHLPARRQAG
jgi:hypothetical protein